MARSNDRIARVNEILKREIADLIEKYSLSEKGALVSITKVHASECLHNATVYVSIFGADVKKGEEILKKLVRLRPEIQHIVSRHVILKYTPVLHFVRDNNLETGDRVLSILRELEEK
ncbi:MAG: Ribosome-binding factor A [Lentisphaerae bacterium ADurb.Bin242]|nr:MAG: Ribosome-binding factor A [Lentisphaerae bacterium ADurb.Bin242]